jgi:hypothetical protein
MLRAEGAQPPWTTDPILAKHRFTNTYRASDRVSQYLIRHIIYDGSQDGEDVVLRTLLFKLFNRISTWELLVDRLGSVPTWKGFDVDRYASILDSAYARGDRLYSAAYIMPSPAFGSPRKHRNHLQLLDLMMRDSVPAKIARARSLLEVFEIIRGYPSLGDFLAFQFAIDLNYSDIIDFSEMDFVVAGPGAVDGIAKCFSDTSGMTPAEVITHTARIADEEFARLGLRFQLLGGKRPLQLIDHQNVFCEVGKYARVAHPEFPGSTARARIKQNFLPSREPLSQFYAPKWNLNGSATLEHISAPAQLSPQQISLAFFQSAG